MHIRTTTRHTFSCLEDYSKVDKLGALYGSVNLEHTVRRDVMPARGVKNTCSRVSDFRVGGWHLWFRC